MRHLLSKALHKKIQPEDQKKLLRMRNRKKRKMTLKRKKVMIKKKIKRMKRKDKRLKKMTLKKPAVRRRMKIESFCVAHLPVYFCVISFS